MKKLKDLVTGDKVWVVSDRNIVYSAEVVKNEPPTPYRHTGYVEVEGKDLDIDCFEYLDDDTSTYEYEYPDTNVVIEYTIYANPEEAALIIKNEILNLKEKIEYLERYHTRVLFDKFD